MCGLSYSAKIISCHYRKLTVRLKYVLFAMRSRTARPRLRLPEDRLSDRGFKHCGINAMVEGNGAPVTDNQNMMVEAAFDGIG
jgi:hypothetical protein